MANETQTVDLEALARAFHEAYERLAPRFNYQTRRDTAVPWDHVPDNNRALMCAVVAEVVGPLARIGLAAEGLREALGKLRIHYGYPAFSQLARALEEAIEAFDTATGKGELTPAELAEGRRLFDWMRTQQRDGHALDYSRARGALVAWLLDHAPALLTLAEEAMTGRVIPHDVLNDMCGTLRNFAEVNHEQNHARSNLRFEECEATMCALTRGLLKETDHRPDQLVTGSESNEPTKKENTDGQSVSLSEVQEDRGGPKHDGPQSAAEAAAQGASLRGLSRSTGRARPILGNAPSQAHPAPDVGALDVLSHDDACRLSRVFNAHREFAYGTPNGEVDARINEWLKRRIAEARR